MKVTAKIVANFEDEGKLKAIATVCLDGRFLVTGVRIVDCKKGLVVFMPSRKTEDESAVPNPLGEQESSTVQWTVEKGRTGPHP